MNKRLILGVAVLLVFGTQSFAQNERVLGPLGKNFVTTVLKKRSIKLTQLIRWKSKEHREGRSITG